MRPATGCSSTPGGTNTILQIDSTTGAGRAVTHYIEAGTPNRSITADTLLADVENDRLFITNSFALYVVDLISGERIVLSR